ATPKRSRPITAATNRETSRRREEMKGLAFVTAGTVLIALGTAAIAADNCEGRKRYSIYFATHAIPHPFWSCVEARAKNGAEDACLDYKWTQDVQFSVATTIDRMEAAIAEKPDMLVITATDPTAMRPTVERAQKAGIPVIAINVADTAPRDKRLPYLV